MVSEPKQQLHEMLASLARDADHANQLARLVDLGLVLSTDRLQALNNVLGTAPPQTKPPAPTSKGGGLMSGLTIGLNLGAVYCVVSSFATYIGGGFVLSWLAGILASAAIFVALGAPGLLRRPPAAP